MDDKNNLPKEVQYVTEEDLKLILTKYGYGEKTKVEEFTVNNASETQLIGFQADYVILKVIVNSNEEKKAHQFFIKAVSKVNDAKAKMVLESNYFQTEVAFYEDIKAKIDLPDLKPWSAKLVANLRDSLVFEDLTFLQYHMRHRHDRFDIPHILEALKTLSRFHANTIIYEERMSKKLKTPYRLYEEYKQYLGNGSFHEDNAWFRQCRNGALEAVKEFSKYKDNKELMETIVERWCDVWNSALVFCGPSSTYRNVVTHKDLWSNNMLFHYEKQDDTLVPDDCVLVDFQGVGYQPPAGDVMMLLHCNLPPQVRKDNIKMFLNFYYRQLRYVLGKYDVNIEDIVTEDSFKDSAKEQNLWGLVIHSCLTQVFWLDDDRSLKLFSDPGKFDDILNKDKPTYVKAMIVESDHYKQKVMETFEEFVDDYILKKNDIAM